MELLNRRNIFFILASCHLDQVKALIFKTLFIHESSPPRFFMKLSRIVCEGPLRRLIIVQFLKSVNNSSENMLSSSISICDRWQASISDV